MFMEFEILPSDKASKLGIERILINSDRIIVILPANGDDRCEMHVDLGDEGRPFVVHPKASYEQLTAALTRIGGKQWQ